MSDELDPEVIADLQLRASSERDSSRARPSMAALSTWTPDEKPAGMWRCKGRGKGKEPCPQRAIVPVSADTIERLMAFNVQLRKRGEDPIDTDDVVRCEPCRRGIAALRPAKLRERVDQIAAAIRELKASADPRRERELIKQLDAWDHPDVPGLLQCLDDKARTSKGKRMGRESL